MELKLAVFPIPNMNLSYATSDIYYSQSGGLFRADYLHLLNELQELQKSKRLDDSYLDNVVEPFINYLLYKLDADRFKTIFSTHTEDLKPEDKNIQSFLPVLAEALLQRNYQNQYYKSAFDDLVAFQAVVDTIFNLARENISTPMPPLVAWNRKHKGPFTITAAKIWSILPIPIGVVCLPPEYRNAGLFAWSVMGHEVAGHNFIQEKPGLLDELENAVQNGFKTKFEALLKRKNIEYELQHVDYLSKYWVMSQRIEEIASDILGVLSTGPSLAIGCIGYFRGMSKDRCLKTSGPFEANKKRSIFHIQGTEVDLCIKDLSEKVEIKNLRGIIGNSCTGEELRYTAYKTPSSPHPVEVLRPFAMAEAIKHTALGTNLKKGWTHLIKNEVNSNEFSTEKSIKIISIDIQIFPPERRETVIPYKVALLSAKVVANIIITTKLSCLGDKKISQIFNWSIQDEYYADSVRQSFQKGSLPSGVSASHIVAAAVIEASVSGADIEALFRKMKQYLTEIKRRV